MGCNQLGCTAFVVPNPGWLHQPMIKKPLSIPSGPALLAISGGRDSVALLQWLISAGYKKLILCHLNHGLRGRESGQDAAFVRRLATRYGLKCEIRKADAAAHARQHHLSVETAGRELRHAFLFEMARKHRAKSVFMAHHADDQAETILANLCRGASLRGVGGMLKITPLKRGNQRLIIQRPFLDWRRADIAAYVQEHRLTFREDSSNLSLQYRRNRLRHEVLPLLNDIFNRDVAANIARFGQHAQLDDLALWQMAQEHFPKLLASDNSLIITPELCLERPAILSRIIHFWLLQILKLKAIDSDIIESAMTMLRLGGPAKINLPGALHLRRKAKRLWVE